MTKSELRKAYLERRSGLEDTERLMASHWIFENIQNRFDLMNKTVSVFLPIEKFKEIDTRFFIGLINANFVVPVVEGEDLNHIRFTKDTPLKISPWGIPEPESGPSVNASDIDFVLVPLLIFDLNGHRVGYGKGFYDRFLANCRKDCVKIGLCYFEPVEKIEDIGASDVKLDFCVTPEEIFTF